MGIVGLVGLIGLMYHIGRRLYCKATGNPLALAAFAALAALTAINVFTPYLNHPLGLGMLILGTFISRRPDEI